MYSCVSQVSCSCGFCFRYPSVSVSKSHSSVFVFFPLFPSIYSLKKWTTLSNLCWTSFIHFLWLKTRTPLSLLFRFLWCPVTPEYERRVLRGMSFEEKESWGKGVLCCWCCWYSCDASVIFSLSLACLKNHFPCCVSRESFPLRVCCVTDNPPPSASDGQFLRVPCFCLSLRYMYILLVFHVHLCPWLCPELTRV